MIQRSIRTAIVLALVVVVFFLVMPTAAQVAPGDGLAAIESRVAQLENHLHKPRAIRDIKRLQYSYAHYAELGLWSDLGDPLRH